MLEHFLMVKMPAAGNFLSGFFVREEKMELALPFIKYDTNLFICLSFNREHQNSLPLPTDRTTKPLGSSFRQLIMRLIKTHNKIKLLIDYQMRESSNQKCFQQFSALGGNVPHFLCEAKTRIFFKAIKQLRANEY